MVRFQGSGPHPTRQTGPHTHSSWLSPDGSSILVVDLGMDALSRFPVEGGRVVTARRETFAMPAGSGPRHCAFGDEVLYVATELSDEVLVLSWPEMDLLQRVPVNPERPGGGSHLVLGPDGHELYVSSRLKRDGIYIFSVASDGRLAPAGFTPTGAHPRHFCLSPDGSLLAVACRDDDIVQLFNRASDGSLSPQGQAVEVSRPVYVEIYEEN